MANAPAAAQALALLQLLARHAEPMPGAAIARQLGLPRSSTYHLLGVLSDSGFVTHLRDERRWGLGVAAFELGTAYVRQAPLQRIARPVLARLVDATTHNAHLAVLHGRDVYYVIEERARGRPSLVTDVGVRLPASVTASGLAMLAVLPPVQVRALYPDRGSFVQRNNLGVTSLTALRSELAQVRKRGYAVETSSVTTGFASIAVAVLDHNDRPAAGIAVTYPVDDAPDAAALVDAVRSAAAELSTRLGRPRAPADPR
ncbi:IclR family transcriptional regulator [Flexivirga caeni]|uniref:IclR family transcriptional regulator n=1 Tax=Flexivirga caeni TaxID=2294115 RepID=A0A3M9M5V7_9MICO|nr:IclR family transcriptional regulator [Flexivirga caeni]RNI19918.1 IclR family transcriptional regulator [Flexivirga caeni]